MIIWIFLKLIYVDELFLVDGSRCWVLRTEKGFRTRKTVIRSYFLGLLTRPKAMNLTRKSIVFWTKA